MFTQLHSCHGLHRMLVIRSRDRHRINAIVLLVEHFPVVPIIFGFGMLFYTSFSSFVIYIAKENDVCVATVIETLDITVSFPSYTDPGYSQFVTGSLVAWAADHMSRNDVEGCQCCR